ncbi:ATP-binding cassette sub-family G member 4-like isoform X2 [Daktulosphaira vitifoliae]|uniref:ATP-binding cassette sub-family G member 4-like isoform X2 n=1 Tax=Daktulosphaira vitifoliae TaxID=58002 RepID=UPI0021A99AE1|nr:ATP-binding cassette sub-family G member 4-like isoform X2 [Daktulosphaira vitifoliae]
MNSKLKPFDEKLSLVFNDISYKVFYLINNLKIEKKCILQNVSGQFSQNQLCAIIGSSGCGKTSLLNFLSGYKTRNYSGSVLINGKPRKINSFKKQSCYIMQDDQLHDQLTVHETMEFAIKLKSSTLLMNTSKTQMMDSILNLLNLRNSFNTLAKNLSGGQRKKLSIALELVHNPNFMFFDEPTSGLDSASTKQVIQILKDLANSGRTVISTIHQVSSKELKMFDVLYVLSSSGYCIYHGLTSSLTNFLEKQKLQCPLYHNIADFIIEVSMGEYGDRVYELMTFVENGKSPYKEIIVKKDNILKDCELSVSNQFFGEEINFLTQKYTPNSIKQFIVLLQRYLITLKREKGLCTSLYCCIVYYLTDQPLEWSRFYSFVSIMFITALLVQAAGMVIGTLFSDPKVNTFLATVLILSWTTFSGIFIRKSDSPKMFHWLFDCSFYNRAIEAILSCVYGTDRPNLKCFETFCFNTSPKHVFTILDMKIDSYWYNFYVLLSMYLILKVLSYFTVKNIIN